MSKIKLSVLRSYKLQEICEYLFPELNIDVHIKTDKHIDLNDFFVDFSKKTNKNQESKVISIHWFEFCIMDLATKLFNLNNRSEISTIELYRGNIIQNYHPVDYLYQEYLFYKK